jgi:plasmid stabilization system protein ParE
MRIRFDQDARKEYLEAIVFYSNRDQKIGVRFADAIEAGIAVLGATPTRFRELEDGIRRYRVPALPLLNTVPCRRGRNSNSVRQTR